jgi:hypothetical protein
MQFSRRGFFGRIGLASFAGSLRPFSLNLAMIGDPSANSRSVGAAQRAGFSALLCPISDTIWRKLLADSGISAIAILAGRFSVATALSEAIAAGKHIWVESPAIDSEAQAAELDQLAQSSGVILASGSAAQSNTAWQFARGFVDSAGSDIAFCRVAGSGNWLAHAQTALGHPPASAIVSAASGSMLRYPGLTLAYEPSARGREGVWFHTSQETLAVTARGIARCSTKGAKNFARPSSEETWQAHWTSLRDAIQSGSAPGPLAGYVRSALIRRELLKPRPSSES